MPFFDQSSRSTSGADLTLSQRGRAGMALLGSIQHYASGEVRARARADFAADPEGAALLAVPATDANAPLPERIATARAIAERSPNHLFERFYQRYVAEEVYLSGIPAVEERRDAFEAFLNDPGPDVGGTLELDPGIEVPDYYAGVQWHLEPDGWDGYDLYGPMFAFAAMPHIFRRGGYASVECGEDIVAQRKAVIGQLPKPRYGRIYEQGCGGLSTLACVASLFPEAELIGSDLSPQALRMGHISANRLGIRAQFKQRDARDTREPDASVDAVISYAVLHEMPPDVAVASLAEAYRILKPGGDMLISDPPPFRAVDALQAVLLDWDTVHRAEPFFSAAGHADWAAELRAIGFADVAERALGRSGYPFVTTGRKPA